MSQHLKHQLLGPCVDALNEFGRPTPRQLKNLGANAVRMEMRDAPNEFLCYYNELNEANVQVALLIGPSTKNVVRTLNDLQHEPALVIIGNEPDNLGTSSWTQTPEQYIELYNRNANFVRDKFPNVPLSTAGMFGYESGLQFLDVVLPNLEIHPTYNNRHYPNTSEELQALATQYMIPIIIGEWCWFTGTRQEIIGWQITLSSYAHHSFWFCWSEAMVQDHGLVSAPTPTPKPLRTYRYYKAAITAQAVQG